MVRIELLAFREHLRISKDDCKNVVEVMRQPAGKLADRLHLLTVPELVFKFPPFGDVAVDSAMAFYLSGGVEYGLPAALEHFCSAVFEQYTMREQRKRLFAGNDVGDV